MKMRTPMMSAVVGLMVASGAAHASSGGDSSSIKDRLESLDAQQMEKVREVVREDDKLMDMQERSEEIFWEYMNQEADTDKDLRKVAKKLEKVRARIKEGEASQEDLQFFREKGSLMAETRFSIYEDPEFKKRFQERDRKLFKKMLERHPEDPRLAPLRQDSQGDQGGTG